MRGFSRAFWILIAGAFVNRLGGFVLPLLALYLHAERGLSVEEIGVTLSLWGVGSILAGPAGGFLSDRVGRRRTLLTSLVAGAFAMLHLAAARAPLHIAFAALLLGLFGEMYRPAVSASIADLVPSGRRAQAYNILYWVVNIGFAVAASLGGVLADRSFTLVFVADAATTLVFAVVIYVWTGETRPTGERERVEIWAPLRQPSFVVFCLLIGGLAMLFIQAFVTLPLTVAARGLSPKSYGALISINGVLIAVLQPFVAQMLARFRRSRVLAASSLMVGIGFGLTAFCTEPKQFALSIAVWTLGEIAMGGIGPAVVADFAPLSLRGSFQGFFQMAWAGSQLFGPILGSLIMGRLGTSALWFGCTAVGCAIAVGHLLLGDLSRIPQPSGEEGSGRTASAETPSP